MEASAKKARSPPHIPIEIIRPILLKLKIKALIRSQSVCKEWRSIIQDDPDFKLSYRGRRRVLVVASGRHLGVTSITNSLRIKTLFQVRGINNPHPHYQWSGVWCSCNGVVLVSVGKHILLWNPSTRCCTKVLELERLIYSYPNDVVSGLCYVSSTGDYKAVLFLRCYDTVMVASLRNKEWRKVSFPYNTKFIRDGVNFHNTLHWRFDDSLKWLNPSNTFINRIVYFEPESDEFKELPTPRGESLIVGLGIMDDYLSMARLWKETDRIEVLVRKKESWVSQFVISTSKFMCDYHDIKLCSSKCNTKVLIICSTFYGSGWEILVFDLKNNTLNHNFLKEKNFCGAVPDGICSYVQSIVSPHEFIWRDDDQHKLPSENDAAVLRFILERFNI